MSIQADFTDTVSAASIDFHPYIKKINTYLLGKITPGDSDDEPRIVLAKWLYDNWACSIPLDQIGYDQYFSGFGDIIIKFKEDNATIVGGMTGHTDFTEASMFLFEIPYRSRVTIYIEVRANTPDNMPIEMQTLKLYIKEFIRRRPMALKDEGYPEIYLTDGGYNYPELRDKNTFKDTISVMMKYTKVYRS
jgi:hypothetical protein